MEIGRIIDQEECETVGRLIEVLKSYDSDLKVRVSMGSGDKDDRPMYISSAIWDDYILINIDDPD